MPKLLAIFIQTIFFFGVQVCIPGMLCFKDIGMPARDLLNTAVALD